MNDTQIIDVLKAYADYLHVTNFVSDGLRWIGYQIILGLTMIVNAISGIFTSMYKLLDFWSYAPFQKFLRTYDPVIWALATLGLLWAGLMMMHNKRVDYQEKGNNFLVAVLIFFSITFMMTQGTKLITAGARQATLTPPSVVSIYKGNITDVYMLDKAGWPMTGGKAKLPSKVNQISDMEDIRLLSINEKVDTGGWFGGSKASDDGTKILAKQLSMNADGKWELHNMQGAFKIDDNYYRYSWHPWLLAANLFMYLITVSFVIFKLIKILMEINFIGMLAQGAALTDIDSGKRNRQLISKLRDSFVVAFLLCVILQFYAQFLSFITQAGVSGVAKVFAMVGAFFFVLDGPNIVQSIFGIDAGLSSMAQSMTNVMLLGRGVGGAARGTLATAKAVGGIAKNVAGKGVTATAGAVGFGMGLAKKPQLPSDAESPTSVQKPNLDSDHQNPQEDSPKSSNLESQKAEAAPQGVPTLAGSNDSPIGVGVLEGASEGSSTSAPELPGSNQGSLSGLSGKQDYSAPDVEAPEFPDAAKGLVGSKLQPGFSAVADLDTDSSAAAPVLGTNITAQGLGVPHVSASSMPAAAKAQVMASQNAYLNDQQSIADAQGQSNLSQSDTAGTLLGNKVTDLNIAAHQQVAQLPLVSSVRRAYQVGQNTGIKVRNSGDNK